MSDHWYGHKGEERYDADLRTARKEHLLPSVTTILKVLNKPGLQIWKENLIYNAMLGVSPSYSTKRELPPFEETGSEIIARVKKQLKIEMGKSAEEGKRIHREIEQFFTGPTPDPTPIQAAMVKYCNNFSIMGLEAERSFGNLDLGYGGKIDLEAEVNGEHAIIDWKTKETKGKREGSIRLFDEVPMQLAACAQGIWEPKAKLYTVIVSRDEPGRIDPPVLWKDAEKRYIAFHSAHVLWCSVKDYNPWTGGKWF